MRRQIEQRSSERYGGARAQRHEVRSVLRSSDGASRRRLRRMQVLNSVQPPGERRGPPSAPPDARSRVNTVRLCRSTGAGRFLAWPSGARKSDTQPERLLVGFCCLWACEGRGQGEADGGIVSVEDGRLRGLDKAERCFNGPVHGVLLADI